MLDRGQRPVHTQGTNRALVVVLVRPLLALLQPATMGKPVGVVQEHISDSWKVDQTSAEPPAQLGDDRHHSQMQDGCGAVQE